MMNVCFHGDCLVGMRDVETGSVDFVFTDLPYGRTQNYWDQKISLPPLWKELKRVCKENAAIVFTAMQPFTSELVQSNLDWFRFEMIWCKNKSRGFLNAKKQPLRSHENILVFYKKQPDYVPKLTDGHRPVNSYKKHQSDGTNYGKTTPGASGGGSTRRYPTTLLEIPVLNEADKDRSHPTQKPVDLVSWFIETYTKPGDLVLDPAAGSGTTLVSAFRLGRRAIGFEKIGKFAREANRRLAQKR